MKKYTLSQNVFVPITKLVKKTQIKAVLFICVVGLFIKVVKMAFSQNSCALSSFGNVFYLKYIGAVLSCFFFCLYDVEAVFVSFVDEGGDTESFQIVFG